MIKEFERREGGLRGHRLPPRPSPSPPPRTSRTKQGDYIYGFCQDATTAKSLYAAVQTAVDAAARRRRRLRGGAWATWASRLQCVPWTSTDVIANTTGIDALLDGHSHSLSSRKPSRTRTARTCCWPPDRHQAGQHRLRCVIATDGTLSTRLNRWSNYAALHETAGASWNDVQPQ